ncbi:hypothetical protein niasHT_028973 [Heterodera trifolii]|uniref:Amino acid permease/ SLC12A domain-containing protein n=1 Tax=Heterodera trifolii TaxID=157864 RepID=A0ABD2JAU5_9BILA
MSSKGVCLLTIQHFLGVTMFIRLAWITFLTCISVSAVATNGVVEGGGAYFIISRNLGPAFGTAVGILFYLANTVATSMYLIGGIEILLLYLCLGMTIGGRNAQTDTGFLGMMSNNLRLYATFVLIVVHNRCDGCSFCQTSCTFSLVCVILSVLACYAGAVEKTITGIGQQYLLRKQFHPNYSDPNKAFQDFKTSFFLIMAIYFSAVTGILTGTNMSGNLANPQKSMPWGTIAAKLTTTIIYLSMAFVFGATIKPELNREKEHAKTEQVVGRDGGRRKKSDERHRRLTAGARRAPANQSTACGSRADFFRSP